MVSKLGQAAVAALTDYTRARIRWRNARGPRRVTLRAECDRLKERADKLDRAYNLERWGR